MISIIIPTLNEENCMEKLAKNLAVLKGKFEVILVDGGSTDTTLGKVSFPARVIKDVKGGRGAQLNEGAKNARGSILFFLHADTTLPSGALLEAEKAIKSGYLGGRFRVRLDEKGLVYRLIETGINLRDRFTGGSTGDQCIFVRRDIFEELGGFEPIPICEDLDFARRLKRKGQYVQLPLYVKTSARRWKKEGPFKVILLMWLIRLLFLLRFPPAKLKKLYGEVR
jgi:rSAM/selenodomain-associated transferase 2